MKGCRYERYEGTERSLLVYLALPGLGGVRRRSGKLACMRLDDSMVNGGGGQVELKAQLHTSTIHSKMTG